jgi:hypothetical protein
MTTRHNDSGQDVKMFADLAKRQSRRVDLIFACPATAGPPLIGGPAMAEALAFEIKTMS